MWNGLKYSLVTGALLALMPHAFAATPADTLVIAKQIDDLISLDPAEAYELSGIEVLANAYDRIMRFEPTDVNSLVPGAAESVEVSEDGRTFTFKMRPGQTFASGNPVTAGDAAWSLQRVIKLEKSPVFLLSQLGWTKENVDTMVTAPDESTLVVQIGVDFAPSLVYALLGSVVGSVVDSKLALENEVDGDLGNAWLKTTSAGSGAYVIRSWTPNEAVVLASNPNYRGGEANLKRVVVQHIPEASAQRLALEKGDVDIAMNLSPDQIASIEGNADIEVTTVPQALLYYIGLNQKTPELQDPKVRQALRHLVDYEGIANSFLKGAAQVHQSFWAEGFWASYNENPYDFDPEKAKALLAEAGLPDGFTLDLDAPNFSPFVNMAQSVQSTFAQAGVTVNIVSSEMAPMLTKYRAREHEALMVYWGPDYMDPHTNADGFITNNDNSDEATAKPLAWRNAWDSPELTAATKAAAEESDTEARMRAYIDLQKRLLDEGPYVIMFQATSQRADRANVEGFVQGSSADVTYYNLTTK
ncbi:MULTISPECIES: ABC transporter substrate-binding protein [unclassified Devosia]|uniref:ABC transporter substrate-binding protein n=1 Tax=unclassified Devosia TaxID=196773 RepID=UPI001556D609|nr:MULTISPECIES: ABC transporter substrate-binding protein [unclassified Devosia]